MKAVGNITGRVFSLEHICNDPSCECNSDPFVQTFKGKWGVEMNMLGIDGEPKKKPLILGPFETEASAKVALEDVAKNIDATLREKGLKTVHRKPEPPRPYNARR